MILGAHIFTSQGYKATFEEAKRLKCEAVQVFTKNQKQWKASPITDEDMEEFTTGQKQAGVKITMAHGSYIINVASAKKPLWHMSLNSLIHEIERCSMLSIPLFVLHPGSAGESDRNEGIKSIIKALNQAIEKTSESVVRILLETAAGQGNTIGNKFEELAELIDGVENKERIGVCFDTCHVFAAGYDIRSEEAYKKTIDEFKRTIGFKNLFAFHINDSVKPLGSRVDRHDHIGKGQVGVEAFSHLLNDTRFQDIPMVIETPKDEDMDSVNLKVLRGLVVSRSR